MASNTTTDFIKTHLGQLVKTFSGFDGSNRLITYLEAPTGAKDGDAALLSTYTYDGTSSRILKSRETASTWSSSNDI